MTKRYSRGEGPRPTLRLKFGDRRDQLVAIRLGMLVKEPIHSPSLDDIVRRAKISRSVMFHYRPTKRDYFDVFLTSRPKDPRQHVPAGADSAEAPRFVIRASFEQIDRRRDFHLAFVFGQLVLTPGVRQRGWLHRSETLQLRPRSRP